MVKMAMEHSTWKWLRKAKNLAEEGIINDIVSKELFDHTWAASLYQLQKHLEIREGHKLLDAGCGWGRLIFGIKYFNPNVSLDGYELTAEFVHKARDILRCSDLDEGVRIIQADLLEAEIAKEYYDGFFSVRVLHYIGKKQVLIKKLHSCLKDGGRGIIIIPNRNCPYRWLTYKHAPLFPISSIGQIMKRVGFRNIYYGGYGMIPPLRRFSHDSIATKIEQYLSSTILGRCGGLAYVVGQK